MEAGEGDREQEVQDGVGAGKRAGRGSRGNCNSNSPMHVKVKDIFVRSNGELNVVETLSSLQYS